MIVYRLSKAAFSHDLSGKGAEMVGGRWNSRGIAMVYTSDSRALCTAEIAVHMPLGIIPQDYSIITIDIPDIISIFTLEYKNLPPDWKTYPHSNTTQMVGDSFVKAGKHAVMKVPSVVVQGDYNYLINPHHSLAGKIKIVRIDPFEFDERLFVR